MNANDASGARGELTYSGDPGEPGRSVAPRAGYPASSPPLTPEPGEELRRLSAMLRRRAPGIITVLVLVSGAVTAATLVWPRTYRSTALIVIEQRSGSGDATLALLGQLGRANQIETEIELIKSRHVMERVVDQLDLHATVEPLPPIWATVPERLVAGARRLLPGGPATVRPRTVFPSFDATPDAPPRRYRIAAVPGSGVEVRDADTERLIAPSLDAPARTRRLPGVTLAPPQSRGSSSRFLLRVTPFAQAVDATRDRISASRRQRDADLIDVRCEGRSPDDARALCQAVVDSYMGLRMDLRRAEATATAQFLRGQVDVLGGRLAAAEDSVQAYGSRHRVVALGERAAEEVRQFTQLTAQRDQLQAERTALSGLIDQIQRGEDGTRRYRDLASFPTFLQNDAVTQLLVTLVNLENDRSALRLRRAETSTEVAALDGRIREIEQQLLSIGVSYRQALDAQIRSLDGALRTSGRRLAAIPERQVQSARLERQAGLLNDLHALLETRLREAEVAEAVNLPNVRVVDRASLPVVPSHPRQRLNLVLGSVLGLALGLMVAIYRESADHSIRERREVERQFGLPVLATIPRLRGSVAILPVPALRHPGAAAAIAEGPRHAGRARQQAVPHEARPPKGRSTAHHRLALESFRALAMDLRFATRHLNGSAPVVTVTSAVRGEGKTCVACNLALARAAQGARTLLIDADIRGAGARRLFGLASYTPGLSDVLAAATVRPEEAVWKGCVKGAELWVIPPGAPRLYSARIFEFPKFASLLEHAKLQFDLIVIDTPPVNVVTDALPIAAVSDAVLLVVRGSVTTRDCLEVAVERLGRARAYVAGAVLNDVATSTNPANRYRYATAYEVPS